MAAGPTIPSTTTTTGTNNNNNNSNNHHHHNSNATWAFLPSILVVDILSYLSLEDRIRASTVCKRWRCCLFHPSLWPRLVLELSSAVRRRRSKFLAARCGRFVRQTEIVFDSHNINQVRDCLKLLHVVATNKNTQCFTLRPSGCQIEWPTTLPPNNNVNNSHHSNNVNCDEINNNDDDDADSNGNSDDGGGSSAAASNHAVAATSSSSSMEPPVHTIDQYLDNIEALIKNSRHLQHFALGCVEELLEHSNVIVNLLTQHHASTLQSLHLASVKEDSESYGIIDLNANDFCHFTTLHTLSLDYDYLTNDLLHIFLDSKKTKLEVLVINVHGIDADHEVITNETWRRLRNHSPDLEVTLNLIHSFEGVAVLLDILQPSMPLAKFRQMFCSNINIASISFISSHYNNTLKEIHIIDGFINGDPNIYEIEADEDPFVMLAWRCPKLEHFTLIGYQACDDDMVAIARLRGQQLKTFDIPASCIYSLHEEEEVAWLKFGSFDGEFFQKVSESLGRDWLPLKNSQLPAAVLDAQADAEPAYMHILLDDQAWKGRNQR